MEEFKSSDDDILLVLPKSETYVLKKYSEKYPSKLSSQLFAKLWNQGQDVLCEMSSLLKLVGTLQKDVKEKSEKEELKKLLADRADLVKEFLEVRKSKKK